MRMDAMQLHKINELAREYLRLGIATSTTDAVEKALFQLRFEKKHPEKESTPYDILFEKQREEKEEETPREEDVLPALTNQPDTKTVLLKQELARLREEFTQLLEAKLGEVKAEYAQLKAEYARLAEEYAQLKRRMQEAPRPAQDASLSTAVMQTAQKHQLTIKGQPVEDLEAVSVEKIFYAGKR